MKIIHASFLCLLFICVFSCEKEVPMPAESSLEIKTLSISENMGRPLDGHSVQIRKVACLPSNTNIIYYTNTDLRPSSGRTEVIEHNILTQENRVVFELGSGNVVSLSVNASGKVLLVVDALKSLGKSYLLIIDSKTGQTEQLIESPKPFEMYGGEWINDTCFSYTRATNSHWVSTFRHRSGDLIQEVDNGNMIVYGKEEERQVYYSKIDDNGDLSIGEYHLDKSSFSKSFHYYMPSYPLEVIRDRSINGIWILGPQTRNLFRFNEKTASLKENEVFKGNIILNDVSEYGGENGYLVAFSEYLQDSDGNKFVKEYIGISNLADRKVHVIMSVRRNL